MYIQQSLHSLTLYIICKNSDYDRKTKTTISFLQHQKDAINSALFSLISCLQPLKQKLTLNNLCRLFCVCGSERKRGRVTMRERERVRER